MGKLNSFPFAQVEPVRFETRASLFLVGLKERYTAATVEEVPSLWARFAPLMRSIPSRTDCEAYGACFHGHGDGSFDYMAGVSVSSFAGVPNSFAKLSIAAHKYAVFAHREHVSKICVTLEAMLHEWLPQSGHTSATTGPEQPVFFERYGSDFNPLTGFGTIEVWLPVRG